MRAPAPAATIGLTTGSNCAAVIPSSELIGWREILAREIRFKLMKMQSESGVQEERYTDRYYGSYDRIDHPQHPCECSCPRTQCWDANRNPELDECGEAHGYCSKEERIHWIKRHDSPDFWPDGVPEQGQNRKDAKESRIQHEEDNRHVFKPSRLPRNGMQQHATDSSTHSNCKPGRTEVANNTAPSDVVSRLSFVRFLRRGLSVYEVSSRLFSSS